MGQTDFDSWRILRLRKMRATLSYSACELSRKRLFSSRTSCKGKRPGWEGGEKNTRIRSGRCSGCFGLSGTRHFFFGDQPVLHSVSIQAATFFIQLIRTLADLFFDFGIGWFVSDWDRSFGSLGTHGDYLRPELSSQQTALCKVILRFVTSSRGEQSSCTSATSSYRAEILDILAHSNSLRVAS